MVIVSKRTTWAGYVARIGEGRTAYNVSVGNRQLWLPTCRREDNIKI